MATVTVLSPAKLNLFLHIIGKRADGYHNLQTVFQLLDFGDEMTFTPNNQGEITIDFPLPIAIETNLIYRAAKQLQALTNSRQGCRIQVNKRIPIGGGLGGGSSNCATTLLALNQLWNLRLKQNQLIQLAVKLGADVPIFVFGHNAFAEGVGEKLTAIDLPECWFLLLTPAVSVNTAKIFAHPDLPRTTTAIAVDQYQMGWGGNDCEKIVRALYPEIDRAMSWLSQYARAQVTGTGATVFASFAQPEEAKKIAQLAPKSLATTVVHGINSSPVQRILSALNDHLA